jgi:hypothetical protein
MYLSGQVRHSVSPGLLSHAGSDSFVGTCRVDVLAICGWPNMSGGRLILLSWKTTRVAGATYLADLSIQEVESGHLRASEG